MKRIILSGLASVVMGLPALGALYIDETFSSGFQNGGGIPDGSLNGLADTRLESGPGGSFITGVTVTLNLAGGYNGDLYVYLAHGSGFAVLLNRVGVGAADAFGASGSGLTSLILTSAGSHANVHFSLGNGNGAGGTFAPDGRAIDPVLSLPSAFDSAGTGANLSTFTGDPYGSWTLFLADTVTGGGSPTLTSWELQVDAVPEPVNVALGIFGVALVAGHGARRCWAGHSKGA
jgi:subtilisin-like proprotein convertase family protein